MNFTDETFVQFHLLLNQPDPPEMKIPRRNTIKQPVSDEKKSVAFTNLLMRWSQRRILEHCRYGETHASIS